MGKACRLKLLISEKTKFSEGRSEGKGLVCFGVKTTSRFGKGGIKGYYIWVSLTVFG